MVFLLQLHKIFRGENSLTERYKIAILIENFDKKGGSERRTYELVKQLKQRGHNITVFANSWSNIPTFEGEGINFVKVPMTRWPFRFMAPLTYAYFADKAVKKRTLTLFIPRQGHIIRMWQH